MAGKDLEDLLDELADAGRRSADVSVADIQDTVGHRSFAPLLAAFGLIVISPAGAIPGVPTVYGVIVILLAGQILIGRKSLWLPSFVTCRAIESEKLQSGTEKIRPIAARVDRILRPRWTFLTQGPALYAIAAACVLLAATLPPLELVPWGAAVPAFAITVFALALMASDGVVAAIGYAACLAVVYLVSTALPFDAIF